MNTAESSLAELFPEGDYRFHLTLRRGEPADFFRARDRTGAVLAERARWLAETPARYAALRPEGAALFAEFAALAAPWSASGRRAGEVGELGAQLEPDFLLLSPGADRQPRLRGGALCFPTGWALEEKLGEPIEAIHGVVPGLNAALGAQIRQFLSRLKPGVAFLRDNWGLAATDELNLHPARARAAPAPPVALERLWLRVEHQALVALPAAGGFVFGIRISNHRLDRVAGTAAARGLRHALETMPEELAAYKRIAAVRQAVAAQL
jgi:hypothetical protein